MTTRSSNTKAHTLVYLPEPDGPHNTWTLNKGKTYEYDASKQQEEIRPFVTLSSKNTASTLKDGYNLKSNLQYISKDPNKFPTLQVRYAATDVNTWVPISSPPKHQRITNPYERIISDVNTMPRSASFKTPSFRKNESVEINQPLNLSTHTKPQFSKVDLKRYVNLDNSIRRQSAPAPFVPVKQTKAKSSLNTVNNKMFENANYNNNKDIQQTEQRNSRLIQSHVNNNTPSPNKRTVSRFPAKTTAERAPSQPFVCPSVLSKRNKLEAISRNLQTRVVQGTQQSSRNTKDSFINLASMSVPLSSLQKANSVHNGNIFKETPVRKEATKPPPYVTQVLNEPPRKTTNPKQVFTLPVLQQPPPISAKDPTNINYKIVASSSNQQDPLKLKLKKSVNNPEVIYINDDSDEEVGPKRNSKTANNVSKSNSTHNQKNIKFHSHRKTVFATTVSISHSVPPAANKRPASGPNKELPIKLLKLINNTTPEPPINKQTLTNVQPNNQTCKQKKIFVNIVPKPPQINTTITPRIATEKMVKIIPKCSTNNMLPINQIPLKNTSLGLSQAANPMSTKLNEVPTAPSNNLTTTAQPSKFPCCNLPTKPVIQQILECNQQQSIFEILEAEWNSSKSDGKPPNIANQKLIYSMAKEVTDKSGIISQLPRLNSMLKKINETRAEDVEKPQLSETTPKKVDLKPQQISIQKTPMPNIPVRIASEIVGEQSGLQKNPIESSNEKSGTTKNTFKEQQAISNKTTIISETNLKTIFLSVNVKSGNFLSEITEINFECKGLEEVHKPPTASDLMPSHFYKIQKKKKYNTEGERTWHCSFPNCLYTTNRQVNIHKHHLRHTTPKSMKCKICSLGFEAHWRLDSHLRREHAIASKIFENRPKPKRRENRPQPVRSETLNLTPDSPSSDIEITEISPIKIVQKADVKILTSTNEVEMNVPVVYDEPDADRSRLSDYITQFDSLLSDDEDEFDEPEAAENIAPAVNDELSSDIEIVDDIAIIEDVNKSGISDVQIHVIGEDLETHQEVESTEAADDASHVAEDIEQSHDEDESVKSIKVKRSSSRRRKAEALAPRRSRRKRRKLV